MAKLEFVLSPPDAGLAPVKESESGPASDTLNYGDVALTTEQANKLAGFLSDEITKSEMDTAVFREKLVTWRQFVDPPEIIKDTPWENAANYFMPIGRIITDAFKSDVKQSVERRQRKLFVSEITSATDAGIDKGMVHDAEMGFIQLAEKIAREPGYAEFPVMFDLWLEEMATSGVGFVKFVSHAEKKKMKILTGRDGDGKPTTVDTEVVRRTGPRWEVVPTETFVWPVGPWGRLAEMMWKGNKVFLTPAMLRLRAEADWNYKNVEEVIRSANTTLGSIHNFQSKQESIGQTSNVEGVWVYDIDVAWDLFGDGNLHCIQVTIAPAARLLMRIVYGDGQERYDFEVVSPRGGTPFGRGQLEHTTQLIKAINTAVNQTFDAQTLSNSVSIITDEGTTADEKMANGFYPGIHLTKQQGEEIDSLKIPGPDPQSFQMVGLLNGFIERLTRTQPGRLGDVGEAKRTPATLGLSIQQSGDTLLDEILDRIRLTAGRMMSRLILAHYEQTSGAIIDETLDEAQAVAVRTVIQHSLQERKSLDQLIRLRLTASSGARSIELERQNAMAVEQMAMGWSKQVVEMMMMLFSPQSAFVPPEAKMQMLKLLQAREEGLRRIVEMADEADPLTVVPEIAETLAPIVQQSAQQMQQAMMMQQQQQMMGGAPGGTAGPPQQGGGQSVSAA